MKSAELVEQAFAALVERTGFVDRPGQQQVALLLNDCIEQGIRSAIEAPTGLGKSLATLIPAIANAIATGKRTVIATYTNVLAEQYWRQDLPLAMSLFETPESPVRSQFLIGRQRYACRQAMTEMPQGPFLPFFAKAELGIETEFRQHVKVASKEKTDLWRKASAPPVCPAKLCPHFNDCYYYKARRSIEKAHIIITNHSVVITDAIMKANSSDQLSLLGDYDFLILDEAHDFLSAAQNGLEFEVTEAKIDAALHIAQRLHLALKPLAIQKDALQEFGSAYLPLSEKLRLAQMHLRMFGGENESAILQVSPNDLIEHPGLKSKSKPDAVPAAQTIANQISDGIETWLKFIEDCRKKWSAPSEVNDSITNYIMYLREFAVGAKALFHEVEHEQVDVTYADGGQYRAARMRRDLLDLAAPLQGLIWDKKPWACVSATMTLDGTFDFFTRTTGAEPTITEVLDSPFDYVTQASLYVPATGKIPDPSVARREGREDEYLYSVARELQQVIHACEGRTLALFSSRKEMEAIYERMPKDPALPIYLQKSTGTAAVGEKFKDEIHSSLFALRSFWTGFDAPGSTLFCVALVRVPFEVPFDPVALGRMAWLQKQGLDPFVNYTLPLAKMLMRQGAGRLIRRDSDRGVIALLDPRLRSKAYGEEIFENMPKGMRSFDDIYEAVAQVTD